MTRILIVEDDPAQARTLVRAFSRLRPDLTILTSNNGVEAIALMKAQNIDLVLTDLQMPEMDGFELVAWLLSNCPDVPVFTMSAYGTSDTAERLDLLGGIEYFTKPVEPKSVLARLTDTLSQSVRGHVQYVSLASFLQLMEMERKTCNLTIRCDDLSGVLSVRKGQLIDARCGDLSGEAAAISIIAWPSPSITITKGCEVGAQTIEKSLGFIVMEAMRVQDENARNAPPPADGSTFPPSRRSWRPSGVSLEPGSPVESAFAPRRDTRPVTNGSAHPALTLPAGAIAIAIVDGASGKVLRSAVKDACPVEELAKMAALVLQQEARTLDLFNSAEGVEELVLSTTHRCDLIRPLGDHKEFALLVFAPDETNLVMARLELEQFIAQKWLT